MVRHWWICKITQPLLCFYSFFNNFIWVSVVAYYFIELLGFDELLTMELSMIAGVMTKGIYHDILPPSSALNDILLVYDTLHSHFKMETSWRYIEMIWSSLTSQSQPISFHFFLIPYPRSLGFKMIKENFLCARNGNKFICCLLNWDMFVTIERGGWQARKKVAVAKYR